MTVVPTNDWVKGTAGLVHWEKTLKQKSTDPKYTGRVPTECLRAGHRKCLLTEAVFVCN